jgi:hypothetical protein
MSVLKKEVDIDIEVLSDEQFNFEQSVTEAKEIYKELESRWITGDFTDDYWEISRLDYNAHYISFDFSKLDAAVFNRDLPKEFKDMVKCWTVQLIGKYKKIASIYLSYLNKAFELTKGFKPEEKDSLLKYIEYSNYTNKAKMDLITTLCNFFDYTELEIAEVYVPYLAELANKIPIKQNIRQLPPSRYVLSFSYYLDKHFEELLNETIKQTEINREILFIYPLIIWWKLTNIIPIRPTEFCLIERNCIFVENGKHYIKLPRRKLNNKRIQILDTILIDAEMYQLISHYIELTNSFGKTDTMISYHSLIFADPTTNRAAMKKNKDQFSSYALNQLIKRFYKTLETRYDCNISKEHHIAPNDTRHFAFISLMMQGYSPIEISRLGGHQTIKAQYHYSGHTEYWVDCEVFKLMKKAKNFKVIGSQIGAVPDEVKLKTLDAEDGSFKRKLKIGYCKDERQQCETRLCYFCSHWSITPEEYLEKQEIIKSQILAKKNNINELIAVISNLNKQFMADELSKRNPELLTKIKTNANAIQGEIRGLAKLCSILGGGEVLDGEKIRWS